MTADDGLAWVGVAPLLLDDVGDGAAVGTFERMLASSRNKDILILR
ncbi:MAG: hypothetical protein WBF34_03825 [Streptosporangiaceae bacterium]